MASATVQAPPASAFFSRALREAPLLAEQPSEPPLHVAMVPFPLQGHINPMMQFAKALVAHHNVVVSFINIQHHHDRIQKTRSGNQLSDRLRLLSVDVDGMQPDRFDFSDIISQFSAFHDALSSGMKDALKQLLQSLTISWPPVSCLCFGSFCHWAHAASVELGLPSFFFWTQSAAVFSIYYHTPLLQANGFFPYAGDKQSPQDENIEGNGSACHNLVFYIDGVPPLYPSRFPTLLHIDDISHPKYNMIKEQLAILPSCQGVIINTFEELEKDCLRALQEELPLPVFFVGPLLPAAYLQEGDADDTSIGASLVEEKVECINWLNRQKNNSVLYISFGSLLQLSAEDAKSIASGIKASKQPFLWVIRPASCDLDVFESLSKRFLDDTEGQGLIISWAPQLQVLSHPAIGAFLTHCGWNSTIESISMGVPTIACPFLSDQPTNAAYLSEFWKIGMELTRHDDGTLTSLDVERVIRTVLLDRGEEFRVKAKEIQELARQAAKAAGGSSFIHIQRFIQFVKELQ